MGVYRAAVRPAFFALPPEAAHRLANRMLGLPLPWERIGGAGRDPVLEVNLAGIRLANPIGLAAGFDKTCAHLGALGRLGFGFVVGGTITHEPRVGNPKPRIARYPRRGSMVNAMGLPNPGAELAAQALAHTPRTSARLVSIADQGVREVVRTHELLEPHVDGVELNASCPNVAWGRDRDNEAHLDGLLRALGARRAKPLLVKLPPFRTAVEREVVVALARVAVEGGADGLVCSNTLPVADRHLATGSGGLSGTALFPWTVRIVEQIRDATDGAVPIVACGGISRADQAMDCLAAGASAVEVYTGLVFRGPRVVGELTAGMAAAMRHARSDLRGAAPA